MWEIYLEGAIRADGHKLVYLHIINCTSIKINYWVHRLEFTNMSMNPNEQIMDYISCFRLKGLKCEFSESELNEFLVEMKIVYTLRSR